MILTLHERATRSDIFTHLPAYTDREVFETVLADGQTVLLDACGKTVATINSPDPSLDELELVCSEIAGTAGFGLTHLEISS